MESVQILPTPIKSEGDRKNYRVIKLPNGLKALLIHKTESNSQSENENLASANLTVGVGSFDEPPDIGGLAHFLEHMLFMGSVKYPEESGYNQFIAANGGTDNAITENEYTTYFFDVSENALPEALDRFAQQFIAPLLLKDALQREREAVDSEFKVALTRDAVRNISFFKVFINDNHPASFFDYGNLKTLKDNITDDELYNAVREFFKKYVANNMFVTVQSKRNLDELQALVFSNFSGIKRGEIITRSSQSVEEIFKPSFYNKMYYIKPNGESKKLTISWYINSVDGSYKCRPLSYLQAVFNNQGDGGISNYLREKQLALYLLLDVDYQAFVANSMFALVKIVIELTDFGIENTDKVLESVFSFLLMLKETSVDEHRRFYEENKLNSEIEFRFHKEYDSSENTSQGSMGLKYFEEVDILRGSSVYQNFDEKVIFDVINAMNERKFNLLFAIDKHNRYDKKQKYFGTEYEELEFPEAFKKLWDERKLNPDFYLQMPNPFRATNFEIFVNDEESTKYPVKIIDNRTFEVWHKLDSKFKVPHVFVRVNILSPKHMTSSYNFTLLKLYQKILVFTLMKKIYPALSAGLSVSLRVIRKGFELIFKGYNEKIPLLVDIVTKSLKNILEEIDETIFNLHKTEIKKNYVNALQDVEALAKDYFDEVLSDNHHTMLEYYQEIDRTLFDDMQKLVQKAFEQTKMHVLVQGNVTKNQAEEIVSNIVSNLDGEPLHETFEFKTRGYQLPLGTNVLRIKSLMLNDDNSFVMFFYQAGTESIRQTCLLRLLEAILHPKAFEYLRSKEQLGYDVGVNVESLGGVAGLMIHVSSQERKHSYSEVCQKIEFFMKEIASKFMDNLSDQEFENFKDSRLNFLSSEDLELDPEVKRNWKEIKNFDFLFDRLELAIKVTRSLRKSDLQDFYKSITQPENMRRLSIQVVGNLQNEAIPVKQENGREMKIEFMTQKMTVEENLITNIEEFHSKLFLHPIVTAQILN